ncbi:MAG: hypothetical protein GY862_23205 [Gammaproteobacteria bacterium]|nr:hypothetical protein [Gammaproteobacteria bacterium]
MMGVFDFLFRRWSDSPAESGGSITSAGGSIGGYDARLPSTIRRTDTTMLKQLREVGKYRSFIREASEVCQLPPSIICGIGSRESHWGLALRPATPAGRGDFARRRPRGNRRGWEPPDGGGYGRGLMQIDYDWHEFARTGNWREPRSNIAYAANELNKSRYFFLRKRIPEHMMTRAILASYNAGRSATFKCIRARRDIDCKTTGRDYSKDVMNRAGWFQLHGWR